MVYLPTFSSFIWDMLANIPYMDAYGHGFLPNNSRMLFFLFKRRHLASLVRVKSVEFSVKSSVVAKGVAKRRLSNEPYENKLLQHGLAFI